MLSLMNEVDSCIAPVACFVRDAKLDFSTGRTRIFGLGSQD